MISNIKNDLVNASELKKIGKNREALKLYQKAYEKDPEEFTINQKLDYAWTIYNVKIQKSDNIDEILSCSEFITQLLSQKDLNTTRNCVYTSCVFKVLNCLNKKQEYDAMVEWLDKIDPELLDEKPFRKYGRLNKSKKEKYYDWATKSYLKTMEYERCIETSKTALNTLKRFIDDGDVWYKWRIAKSLIELNRLKEALTYYEEVIEVKNNWYMYRDIAEIYYRLNKSQEALKYICPAVLSKESNNTKANIFYLCYKVFKTFNMDMAIKHAQLYYLLQKEQGYGIPYEIEKLNFDSDKLSKSLLEREIRALWIKYKFKDQKLQHGTVTTFNHDRNYGFIKTQNDETIFFHKNDYKGSSVDVGQQVSFYTEKNFDKMKNKESMKAVNIRGE